LEAALEQAFSQKLEVTLIPGSNGIFDVTLDGNLLFSKRESGRFPESNEIIGLMRANG
jgi:selenoprotein W-related protein